MQVSGIGSGSSGVDAVSMQKVMDDMKKKWFEKMDANGDGIVDASDLTDLAKTTNKTPEEIIKTYDKDQDGGLSATEFDAMMKEMRPKFHPAGMPPSDQSQSGQAPADEIKALDDKLTTLIEMLKNGNSDEAETVWKTLIANLRKDDTYGENASATVSLLNIQA